MGKITMHNKHLQRLIVSLFITPLILSSCSTSTSTPESVPSSTVNAIKETAIAENNLILQNQPTITPSSTATATPDPLMIFIDGNLPEGILNSDVLNEIPSTDDQNAPFWFGLAAEAPDGEIISEIEWVYALAAPFPTIKDNINLEDLKAYWGGSPPSTIEKITGIYVPVNVSKFLDQIWGAHSEQYVIAVESLPEPQQIWDENAWVILPFDNLDPELKVIGIDGISPLSMDFNPQDYPLTMEYQLINNTTDSQDLSEGEIQPILDAIHTTNRDPGKMTTLVMTGVTALVRATAYKMEINGVLYPGEAIVDWLSSADLTHISNEVSFYENCPYPNPNSRLLLFCSNPEYIELLEYVGTDIVELTGNHNNDVLYVYGDYVVPYNLNLYNERGWLYYGGGADLEDATTPKTIEHNGNQLAFIGCNASGPDFAWATENQGGAAPCGDFEWMVNEIKRIKAEGYLPIATLQYYEDYTNYPQDYQIYDFGLLADAGAIIVNGSQAHRPKGMAFSSNAFIDYGLGNLFFDQMGVLDAYGNQVLQTRWEIIQRHTFYNGHHLSTELLTAMLEDYAQPRPMTIEERAVFLEELFTASGWNSR
jgi:poly-gamma-glutamate synthesis protein (capsule biosynthesis protein)